MLAVQRCAAIWVRGDGYDLIPVDTSPDVYKTFRHAQQVAHWQTVTSKTVVGDVIQPTEQVPE